MSKWAEVLRDPYQDHSPYSIKKHPEGRRLYWKSIDKIKRSGFDGWTPVQRGDGIFEELDEYINDSPLKYSNTADGGVRRGQSILCWKPDGMWLARKKANADRANQIQARWKYEKRTPDGVDTFGPGPRTSRQKDPTDIENIAAAYGITDQDMESPHADPANYRPLADGAVDLTATDDVAPVLQARAPAPAPAPTPDAPAPKPAPKPYTGKPRGRPKKSK